MTPTMNVLDIVETIRKNPMPMSEVISCIDCIIAILFMLKNDLHSNKAYINAEILPIKSNNKYKRKSLTLLKKEKLFLQQKIFFLQVHILNTP